MSISEIILLAIYGFTGWLLVYGHVFNKPKWQITSIFTIESRGGQIALGVVLLGFVIMRVVQWQSSADPTIDWHFFVPKIQ